MQSQVSRDERLAVIENMLFHNPDGVRVVELADVCGVDRRTIYRDMAKLRASGVPVYQKQGRFYVSREHYNATVQLSLNETVALFTAIRVVAQLAEQQNPHAISALSKLAVGLPESMSVHVNRVSELLRQKPVDRLFMRVSETLIRAWSEQRWVRVWTSDDATAVEVAPYFLEATTDGNIHLVGLEVSSKQIRAFRLRHILRCEILGKTFQHIPSFTKLSYLSDPTGQIVDDTPKPTQVRLAFKPDVAQLMTLKKIPSVAKVETINDGRILVTLRVKNWKDLLPWIKTLGGQVEVLYPQAMREAITEEATKILSLYQQGAEVKKK